jgi:hypothetical protein
MSTTLRLLALVILVTGLAAGAEAKPAAIAPADAIATQAAALTAGATDRAARVAALHRFVRDQIAQCATGYG